MAKSALEKLKEKKQNTLRQGSNALTDHKNKQDHLEKTQEQAKNARSVKAKEEEAQKKIDELQKQLDEKAKEEEKKSIRVKRKQKRKRLTPEDIEELAPFLEMGETRIAILTDLNDRLNIYSRKINYNTNTLLSQIVYEYLKDKGGI